MTGYGRKRGERELREEQVTAQEFKQPGKTMDRGMRGGKGEEGEKYYEKSM